MTGSRHPRPLRRGDHEANAFVIRIRDFSGDLGRFGQIFSLIEQQGFPNWFGEQLKARGEVVLDCWGKAYWGRQTTGQCISLDYVIASIADEMQILDGQAHSWAPKPQPKPAAIFVSNSCIPNPMLN